jgi:parallel beta-helix repeat protein
MTRKSLMNKCGTTFLFLLLLTAPTPALCAVLTSDTTWSGEVSVKEDVLVPEGVTLTIAPGTVVQVVPSESTKTDPEYLSPLTEILVRGKVAADGKKGAPITITAVGNKTASWAGIIVDGGSAVLRSVTVSRAETGVSVMKGSLDLRDSLLERNRYGLTVQGNNASVHLRSSQVKENEYGVFLFNGARIDSKDTAVRENSRRDTLSPAAGAARAAVVEYTAGARETGRILGDDVILGTVIWQKRIEVQGLVRVPENSRLIILPGTVVEFKKKDTNGDGIGENGLMVQGTIIAKGTRENPIIFRSAEKLRRMGDWDSINIMNSDKAQNLVEYCQIEDAYRGLHFHFSNVAVTGSVVRNNYRGIQFQESVVEIRGTHLYGNKSGLQARDSEIAFTDNVVSGNYTGMNLLRNSVTLRGNAIVQNLQEGVRVREGLPVVEGNVIDGNRYGLMVNDAVYGTFARNVISHNLEAGLSLRGADNIEISGNAVQGNGLNGINLQDAGASIRDNLITDNGERGIGVLSFQGEITGNNIVENGQYALGIDGPTDVSARMNWWGGGDAARAIYDREDDPSKGRAEYLPKREGPVRFAWPIPVLHTDTVWRAAIGIGEKVTVASGVTLTIAPDTSVLFSKGSGLWVKGKILARGAKNAPVTFASSAGKGASEWDEILIDHAPGSVFSHCIFQNATWALHSHFTDLNVEDCAFTGNYGGLKFTSGPLDVRRSFFEGNEIGIRAYRGKARIADNIIAGNRIGIFVREKGGGLTILRNNLSANSDYNIRMGDFNDEDVEAKNNWWGGAVPSSTIYDARTEPGIGTVQYEPFAKKPFPLSSPFGDRPGKDLVKDRERKEAEGI